MMKEFDIFPPNYMDGLLEYPRKVAFPSKNGKPIMFQFHDGYYSFDKNGKLNGYHLYVKDYQGNVRMVMPDSLEAAQIANHVYDGDGELSGGWTCYARVECKNGLKYGIYTRGSEESQELVLSFAGTDMTSYSDLKTDYDQAMGKYMAINNFVQAWRR